MKLSVQWAPSEKRR